MFAFGRDIGFTGAIEIVGCDRDIHACIGFDTLDIPTFAIFEFQLHATVLQCHQLPFFGKLLR
ncbi:hypothetical protein D3C81_2338800 [compost metagenome]